MTELPKILLIDWYKTLSASKFWGHIEKDNPDMFYLIENFLFASGNNLVVEWMTGRYTAEEAVEITSKKLRLSYRFLYKELVKSSLEMKLDESEIIKYIDLLRKKGFKVYIFTDNMDTFERWTVPALKLDKHFDGIINSYNVKALKSESDTNGNNLFLSTIFKLETTRPENITLYDDNEKTLDIFRNFGVRGMKISSEKPLFRYIESLCGSFS